MGQTLALLMRDYRFESDLGHHLTKERQMQQLNSYEQ